MQLNYGYLCIDRWKDKVCFEQIDWSVDKGFAKKLNSCLWGVEGDEYCLWS